jgi:hypothetical protein
VVVSSAYISFKNGAVPKLHLPNRINARQTVTSTISLDADHVMKMRSIELVEGAAQETEERVRILRPVRIEPTVTGGI